MNNMELSEGWDEDETDEDDDDSQKGKEDEAGIRIKIVSRRTQLSQAHLETKINTR
jgi:hypothetical protein